MAGRCGVRVRGVLVVAALLATGCSDDARRADPTPRRPPTVVPEEAGEGWWPVVATARHLVGRVEGGGLSAIDLEDGTVTPIARPDDPVGSGGWSVGFDTTVVTAGTACFDDVAPDDMNPCRDKRHGSYRLTPATGEWVAMPVPEDLREEAGSTIKSLVASADRAVLTFSYGPWDVVLVSDGDRWEEVRRGPLQPADQTCATATDLYRIDDRPRRAGEDGTVTPAHILLTATDVATGDVREVPVPTLPPDFGLAPVRLGCRDDRVVIGVSDLTVTEAGPFPATTFVGDGNGTWEEAAGLGPGDVLDASLSDGGPSGPALLARHAPNDLPYDEQTTAVVTLDADGGSMVRLPDDVIDHEVLWRGRSGRLVVVGPTEDPPAEGFHIRYLDAP
jgi:hypothetical protein